MLCASHSTPYLRVLPLSIQTLNAFHSTRYCCLSLYIIRVYRLYLGVLPLSIQTLYACHSTRYCCLSLYTIRVYHLYLGVLPLSIQTLYASHSTRYCCLSLYTIRVYRLYLGVLPLSIQTLYASHSTRYCCLSLYIIRVYRLYLRVFSISVQTLMPPNLLGTVASHSTSSVPTVCISDCSPYRLRCVQDGSACVSPRCEARSLVTSRCFRIRTEGFNVANCRMDLCIIR